MVVSFPNPSCVVVRILSSGVACSTNRPSKIGLLIEPLTGHSVHPKGFKFSKVAHVCGPWHRDALSSVSVGSYSSH